MCYIPKEVKIKGLFTCPASILPGNIINMDFQAIHCSVYIDLIQWNFTICIIWLFIKTNGTHFCWNCVLQWHPSHFTFRQFVKIIKCSPTERDRESWKVIAEKFWCQRLHVPWTCVSYASIYWMCLKRVHIHYLVSLWKVSLGNDKITFTIYLAL